MSEDENNGGDYEALRAKFRGQAKSGKKERRKKEARRVAATDGRRLRRTGRTAQLNMRCTPEFRSRVADLAEQNGLLMIEVLERAMSAAFPEEIA